MSLTVLAFVLSATILKFGGANDHAEILEPPENQYALIGNNITISCKTRGDITYWVVNGSSLSRSHPLDVASYEELGVHFVEARENGYYNLTLNVPAIVEMNNTRVSCTAQKLNNVAMPEDDAKIMVFYTLRPLPPSVSVEVDCSSNHSSLPSILATVTAQHRWPDYPITEFNVNITNSGQNLLLNETVIPYNTTDSQGVTVDITAMLPTSFIVSDYFCSTLSISISAVSDEYGESEPTINDVTIYKPPESFPNKALHSTTYFYSNGSFSHLTLTLQLPDVCNSQPLNYTILIEDTETEQRNFMSMLDGHYPRVGPGNVLHDVYGLQGDHTYSVSVEVTSFSWTSLSNKHRFDTKLHLDPPSTPSTGGVSVKEGVDGYIYVIALGVLVLVLLLVLVTIATLFMCFCGYTRRLRVHSKQQGDHPVNGSMVHNPIYDGPVYEVVTATSKDEFHAATPTGSDVSPLPFHYVDEPTEALQHQGVTTCSRSGTRTAAGHTLTTDVNIDVEESYTIMSPAVPPSSHY